MWVPLQGRQRLLGAIGIVSSTQSHRYDEADLRLAEEVARRGALSLENARLYASAERAIAVRDEVLALVAHDLRNPLGTIQVHAQTQRRMLDPGSRAWSAADRIVQAVRRMDRLIQDLLDINRMEAGRLTLERTELDARAVAAESVEAQRLQATESSIDIRLDSASGLPAVHADRDRLLQVFENLIGNALKFTPSGGQVVVGAMRRADAVLYFVRDTGPGISEEDRPHIFERFWQSRRNRSRGRGDSGLGLPIVKGIVDAHGGRIWIESAPGKGTTFYFTIPAATPATEVAPADRPLH